MLVRAGVLALGTVVGFQQFPPFRAAVDLLEVDARVFDSEGVFVTDLRIDDFEVVEDGVPQKIQTMFLVDGRRGAADSATRSMPRSPQTWIFVFDQHHLTMGSYVRARNAVREFLTARFRRLTRSTTANTGGLK